MFSRLEKDSAEVKLVRRRYVRQRGSGILVWNEAPIEFEFGFVRLEADLGRLLGEIDRPFHRQLIGGGWLGSCRLPRSMVFWPGL